MSIYNSILSGSIWMIGMRWANRGLSLVSMIILARLLTPFDFGIVAMAALVSGFLVNLSEFGLEQYLVREKKVNTAHYDSVWTISLIRCFFLGLVMYLSAPLAAGYFGEPRLSSVMQVMAIGSIAMGFRSARIVDLQKNLQFKKDFYFVLINRAFGFVVTILAAWWLRSYWSLVIGTVATTIFASIHSYYWVSYRPRFGFTDAKKLFRFAFIITPIGIAQYLNQKADVFVVGSVANTSFLGAYSLSSQWAQIPTAEVIQPVGRVLLPVFSRISEDREQLRAVFVNVIKAIAILCVSVGVGMSLVAENMVLVLLGEKWRATIVLIEWLAIAATAAALSHPLSGQILIATGHEKFKLFLTWLRLAIFGSAVALAGFLIGVEAIAPAAALSTVLYLGVSVYAVKELLRLKAKDIAAAFIPSFCAGAAMFIGLRGFQASVSFPSPLIGLACEVLVGAMIYVSVLTVIWLLMGRPKGPESTALSYARRFLTAAFLSGSKALGVRR